MFITTTYDEDLLDLHVTDIIDWDTRTWNKTQVGDTFLR